MRLVDLTLHGNVDFKNDKERRKHQEKTVKELLKNFRLMSQQARIRGEDAIKLKCMRILRFGKYIVHVPSINVARHYDYPLPKSYAQSVSYPCSAAWEKRDLIPGQLLHGSMIPSSKSVFMRQKEAVLHAEDQLNMLRQSALGETNKIELCNKELTESTALSDPDQGNATISDQGFEVEFSDSFSVVRTASLRKVCNVEMSIETDGDKGSSTQKSEKRSLTSTEDSSNGSTKTPNDDKTKSSEFIISVPSQIDGALREMDEISALGMNEFSNNSNHPQINQSLSMLTVPEEEVLELDEQGVEIIELEPWAEECDGDNDSDVPDDLTNATPVYKSSDHMHFMFARHRE